MRASERLDEAVADWGWREDGETKHLFLVHQVIARRSGFSTLHALFTGPYASVKAEEEYRLGSHFLLAPFVKAVQPLVLAHRDGDQRVVVDTLRRHSPAFDPQGPNANRTLADMSARAAAVMDDLCGLWDGGAAGDVLRFCWKEGLYPISGRLSEHLDREHRAEDFDKEAHSKEKADWLADEFFAMEMPELERYVEFLEENAPLSTQHGVKGEQYKNVVVVFDDVEAAWTKYSFAKMLTPQTSGEGTEGQFSRSRKLAYVCFSRAEENLRIVLFTPGPRSARNELIARNLFTAEQIEIALLP
ncbi:MAG: DNA helicase-2/ATP-dependent DNA helicase PcrA [Planctomycetota bacterium]|jgi:DNA helicase-2/ATP-dependent DNA helicase PcrA